MTASPLTFPQRLSLFAQDIKLHHTIFAMPFALLATTLAWRSVGGPILGKLGLILICMVTARTVAMAANRLLDASLDAHNPRTRNRAIPAGRLSRGFFLAILLGCVVLFVAATAGFLYYGNSWPLILSLPVLAFLAAYPLLKRFTRLCHYYLGAALALAPLCAWVAIGAKLDLTPFIMFGAVLLWTAGFDIIYACQDYESDLQTGVFSVPAAMGIARALWVSRLSHAGCAALLVLLGWHSPYLGTIYAVGAGLAILLLIVEQSLVSPTDLSKAGLAFFTVNGIVSVVLGTLGIIDALRP